jgi:hypothetical protein
MLAPLLPTVIEVQREYGGCHDGASGTKRKLFVMISLEEYVPKDPLLRAVDRYVDLGQLRLCLADSYSHTR